MFIQINYLFLIFILKSEDFHKYFLSVVIFVISLSILSLFLTISGISSEISFKLSILTLMNTVNSSLTNLENFNFYESWCFFKVFFNSFYDDR